MRRSVLCLFAFLVFLPGVSNAAIISWTLNGFVFSDSGRADGFFVWDTSAADAASWEISLSGGNTAVLPGFVFTESNSVFEVRDLRSLDLGIFLLWSDERIGEPSRTFRLGLAELSGLDSVDATIGVAGNLFAGPTGAIDCFNCSPSRLLSNVDAFLSPTSGDLSQVPLPAALPLLAATLTGFFFMGWRRRR